MNSYKTDPRVQGIPWKRVMKAIFDRNKHASTPKTRSKRMENVYIFQA